MKKLLQGGIVALAVVVIPCALNPRFLLAPQAWILIATGLLGSLFQPAYNPFRKAPDCMDHGTASQIIWTVYLTQLLAVIEAAWLRYPASVELDVVSYAGVIFMALGLFIRSWAFYELGRSFTWHISAQRGQTVIESGPYAYIRHPGYAGAFMTYASTALLLHSWFALAPSALALGLAFARRIRLEEHELALKLGEPYSSYCRRVKRVIPWLW